MRRRSAPFMPTVVALSAASTLVLASCGGPETAEPESAQSSPTDDSPTATSSSSSPSSSVEDSTPEARSEAPTEAAQSRRSPGAGPPPGGAQRMAEKDFDEADHGEATELHYYAEEGAQVGVAGLDPREDPLEIYAAPTRSSEVVAELESTDAVTLGGRERQHQGGQDGGPRDDGFWTEIELADGYGWFNSRGRDAGIYWFGGTTDVTEDYTDIPTAEDGQSVAESVASALTERGQEEGAADMEFGPTSELISEPADFGEEFYRVDVTGYLDDSMVGERLFVYVSEAEVGYELEKVERTLICYRGVSAGGLCS